MGRGTKALAAIAATLALAVQASCLSGGRSDGASPTTSMATTTAAANDGDATGDLVACPEAYRTDPLDAGTHKGFESEGQERSFHLLLPDDDAPTGDSGYPLFVAVTGTVQEEQAFLEQSGLDQLPEDGWIVVAPVRNNNGKVWGPWDAMRTPQMTGPNADTQLILDLIGCIAGHHSVDLERVFVGGISIGGTMVNYLLRHHPDVFAGGIVGSGNWILTAPPEEEPLGPMTVIVSWGGDTDQWIGCPDGRMGEQYANEPGCVTADFVKDSGDAARYYADQSDVALLACHEDLGHIWIAHATEYWASILYDRPKGTTEPIDVGTPPPPLECATTPPAA